MVAKFYRLDSLEYAGLVPVNCKDTIQKKWRLAICWSCNIFHGTYCRSKQIKIYTSSHFIVNWFVNGKPYVRKIYDRPHRLESVSHITFRHSAKIKSKKYLENLVHWLYWLYKRVSSEHLLFKFQRC